MKKLLFLLISVCSLSLSFTAEAKVVRGQVVDASNGEPLIGATITPKGGGHATATDLDGRFSIDVPNNVKDITVTYIGMVTRVVEAADNLLITMETAENTLDDVVVTAYGTSTKGAFTGSAGVVDAATIEKRQVSNLTQALPVLLPVCKSKAITASRVPALPLRCVVSVRSMQVPLLFTSLTVFLTTAICRLSTLPISNR